MKKRLRVVVLMGGKSPEHEISLITGEEVIKNLDKEKYNAFSLVIPKNGCFDIERLLQLSPDIVFIAMHGPYGEDGKVQGLLEFMGIEYTGAGVLASALGMNKIIFLRLMEKEKIPVPRHLVFTKTDSPQKILKKFPFPFVVKPSCQGSSVGVSIVHRRGELKKALAEAFCFDREILIEEYLSGVEITCGILGNKEPIALPLAEILPKKEFFNFEAKYSPDLCEEIVPARISSEMTKKVQKMAVKVYKAIDCRVFARVDMIICHGRPYVLEINTIPGLTPVSLFPKEAAALGISYPELLDRLIELSQES